MPRLSFLRVPRWIREPARTAYLKMVGKTLRSDEGRALVVSSLAGLLDAPPELRSSLVNLPASEYSALGLARPEPEAACRTDAVIITARFRTGSTLLWNLFRNAGGCTAYYEPLSEDRYFEPSHRAEQVDPTHRAVKDYMAEYAHAKDLGRYFRASWYLRNFYMGPDFWGPDLKQFVSAMIEGAPGRPVLQFNRIDFRLPWFRRNFPNARIIHLHRHPRFQWCSTIQDNLSRRDGRSATPLAGPTYDYLRAKTCSFDEFDRHDNYYLRTWGRDLRFQFPFLDESCLQHPYQLFYLIWKLSYIFGKQYAHYSLSFDNLVREPAAQLDQLMAAAGLETFDRAQLLALISKSEGDPWSAFADDRWFREHEEHCESILASYFGGSQSLNGHSLNMESRLAV